MDQPGTKQVCSPTSMIWDLFFYVCICELPKEMDSHGSLVNHYPFIHSFLGCTRNAVVNKTAMKLGVWCGRQM